MTLPSVLYLASQSPRRLELLQQIGIPCSVMVADIDETVQNMELPEDYVVRLAIEKAKAGWNRVSSQNQAVLGSDTAVVINGKILGKPNDASDAKRMLYLLSGQTHQVMTAVALATRSGDSAVPEVNYVLNINDVSFKVLSDKEISDYVATGEGLDKAGAYAIQGFAAAFICHLSGSYSGVMGLPLYETVELLEKAGIRRDSLVVS